MRTYEVKSFANNEEADPIIKRMRDVLDAVEDSPTCFSPINLLMELTECLYDDEAREELGIILKK